MFGDTTSTLTAVGGAVGLLSGLSIVLAGVFFSSKSRGTKEALDSLGQTNLSMENALKFERAERERDNVQCAKDIAHLQGQIDSLQTKQADALLGKVEGGIQTMMNVMLDKLEDGLGTAVTKAVATGVAAGVKAVNDQQG